MSIQYHSPEELAAAINAITDIADLTVIKTALDAKLSTSAEAAITAIGVVANAFTITTSTTTNTALQAATSTTPWGFASENEANAFFTIVKNLHTRNLELEAVLVAQGLLTAS